MPIMFSLRDLLSVQNTSQVLNASVLLTESTDMQQTFDRLRNELSCGPGKLFSFLTSDVGILLQAFGIKQRSCAMSLHNLF